MDMKGNTTAAKPIINDAPSAVLDVRQVAELLGICERGVTRMVERGEFPEPIRFGRRCVWLRSRVMNHLEELDQKAQERIQQAA